jgi:hypothetical protein
VKENQLSDEGNIPPRRFSLREGEIMVKLFAPGLKHLL